MRGGKDLVQSWPALDCLILTEIQRSKTQQAMFRDSKERSRWVQDQAGTSASAHPSAPLSAAA